MEMLDFPLDVSLRKSSSTPEFPLGELDRLR
ncbi:hypothetical protein GGP87_003227 [Salinibacter ruber]|nr:hypothetical protein [Salinibacter ruber]